MEGVGIRGPKPKIDYVGGEPMEIRALVKFGNGHAVCLPKLWLDMVSRKGELKGVGITYNEDSLIVRPYYKEQAE